MSSKIPPRPAQTKGDAGERFSDAEQLTGYRRALRELDSGAFTQLVGADEWRGRLVAKITALEERDVKPAAKSRMTFEDALRLLDKNPGMARQDYTDQVHRAAHDEPEAVSAEAAAHYAAENRRRFEATRTREIRRRDHMTIQGHLREFCMLAARLDMDPQELAQIRQLVDRGRQRLLDHQRGLL